jgi:hypothetical protein
MGYAVEIPRGRAPCAGHVGNMSYPVLYVGFYMPEVDSFDLVRQIRK